MAIHPRARETRRDDRAARSWRRGLPVLSDGTVTLREVQDEDAPRLLEHLSRPHVTRHIAPPPTSIEGFQRYIRWARRKRELGLHASFAVVRPDDADSVGVVQMWPVDGDRRTVEWGCVLSDRLWGGDLFTRAARLLLDYAFGVLRVQRAEARVCVDNERGLAAIQKLGASRELLLRDCFVCEGVRKDHVMWAILAEDWQSFVGASSARPSGAGKG